MCIVLWVIPQTVYYDVIIFCHQLVLACYIIAINIVKQSCL